MHRLAKTTFEMTDHFKVVLRCPAKAIAAFLFFTRTDRGISRDSKHQRSAHEPEIPYPSLATGCSPFKDFVPTVFSKCPKTLPFPAGKVLHWANEYHAS